jgi:hypothetical protein
MMNILRSCISISLLMAVFSVNAGPHDNKVRALLASDDAAWLSDPVLIESIKKQNSSNSTITQRDIDRLDLEWRAETKVADKPVINSLMNNNLSVFLKQVAEKSNGLYSEIIVMDNKGMNAGLSKVTSDYWQGDEDKWKKTFLVGPDALHIDNIKFDDSAHGFQIQASVPVIDPTTKTIIGAVTIGLSMRKLALREVK